MAQSKESEAQARDIKSGRSKDIFKKEQRGKLREEMKENKQEVTKSKLEPKAPTLADRFARIRGRPKQSERPIDPKPVPGRKARQPEHEQRKEPEPKGGNRSGSLADEFRKAKSSGVGENKVKDQFKDNSGDNTHDLGREITKKPPK